jgi:Uma2 family endonuclease
MTLAPAPQEITYPESDGNPIADNTLQFEWIALLHAGFEALYADDPLVFVGADLLWYPVQGDNRTRQAPDVMIAIGRRKGHRGSYRQWEEGGAGPQVVFEILSPGNRMGEMARKFDFYERFGVEEYYIYNPDTFDFSAWRRQGDRLRFVEFDSEVVSPRIGVRFVVTPDEPLVVFRPDGERFKSLPEVLAEREQARAEAAEAKAEAQEAKSKAEDAKAEVLRERERAARLEEELEALRNQVRTLGGVSESSAGEES